MTQLHPHRPHMLAASPLDRQGPRRGDEAWIASLLADPASQFLPLFRTQMLINPVDHTLRYLDAAVMRQFAAGDSAIFLGLHADRAIFAIDLAGDDVPDFGPDYRFDDLRRLAGKIAPADAAIVAQARALLHWHDTHRFCGRCGAKNRAIKAGHVLQCTDCGHEQFPRTDPAVIMLITDGDKALLAQPNNPKLPGFFSTLAGFVEPGESLEEAVAREAFEETGVKIADVVYHSSQPWPFPASIMLGFRARAVTRDIAIDPEEILAARWFTRDEARAENGFRLPTSFSIARRLIDDWLDET